MYSKQLSAPGNPNALNASLRAVEGDLLATEGLPGRSWFRHTIFAPGEYTGYAAVVVPGVNEAIDARDPALAQAQMAIYGGVGAGGGYFGVGDVAEWVFAFASEDG